MPNRVLQKVSELPVAVPWSFVIQTALWLPVGLPWSPQLPCQTNVWPRKQSAPFSEFGRSITGQGRFRAAMPVWRLTDYTDSISGQRRKRKYQRPTEGERRAIIDAHLAGDDRRRDFKKSGGRHGQSSPAINTPIFDNKVVCRLRGSAQHHRLDDESKDLLVMCLEDNPQLTLKHLALILQQSGCRRRGRRCRYARRLTSPLSPGRHLDCHAVGDWRPGCRSMPALKHVLAWVLDEVRYLTSYLTRYLTSSLLPVIFCALLVLTGFDINELPSVLPNVVQYWRCTHRVNTLQFYSDNTQNLLSKLYEHCLIRFALCRIWNVCRNAPLCRNCLFTRRNRCALSPKLNALYSISSSLILITCDTFEYGCTMPYCRKLTALFPNYVHCFQNWPEKGVQCPKIWWFGWDTTPSVE